MDQSSKVQQIISSGIVLSLTLVIAYLSYVSEPAEVFLFPRIIATGLAVLAAWNFLQSFGGKLLSGEMITPGALRTILPGIVVIVIYGFFAAKFLGFYLASTLAFLALFSLYDPRPHGEARSWLMRIITTAVFMAIIYVLFAIVLQVQTPRGIAI